MSDYIPTADITDDDKLWAMLSYVTAGIPIIAVLMLLMDDKKSRPFIKFHAVQALAIGLIYGILAAALSIIVIGCIIGVAGFGYSIYLGVKAYAGEYIEIPFVTDFCKKQGWIA